MPPKGEAPMSAAGLRPAGGERAGEERARPASEALVRVTMPARYLTQFCRHFSHKLPVVIGEGEGCVDFPGGHCALRAEENGLRLIITAGDGEVLARLEDVVARHLARFAFREQPEIRWQPRDMATPGRDWAGHDA